MTIKKILKVHKFEGYEVRNELMDGSEWNTDDFMMQSAYTDKGDYTGGPAFAKRLCIKLGIAPEKANPKHSVCSIGYSKKDKKWYGWSHRAIFGFGIGSSVKRGDCAYRPISPKDLEDSMIRFWKDENSELIDSRIGVPDPHGLERAGIGVAIKIKSVRKSDKSFLTFEYWEPYPETWGPGEWTAKTISDAKQMAIAFAESVS